MAESELGKGLPNGVHLLKKNTICSGGQLPSTPKIQSRERIISSFLYIMTRYTWGGYQTYFVTTMAPSRVKYQLPPLQNVVTTATEARHSTDLQELVQLQLEFQITNKNIYCANWATEDGDLCLRSGFTRDLQDTHTGLQKTGIRASDRGSQVIYKIQIMHTRLQTTTIHVWNQGSHVIYRINIMQ
jgi:hypothetical protein